MRIKALTCRIIKQIINDKRTIGLVLIAPIVILTMVYFVLNTDDTSYNIGIINAPDSFTEALQDNEDYDISIKNIKKEDAEDLIKSNDIIASVEFSDDNSTININVNGSDAADSKKIVSIIKGSGLANVKALLATKHIPFDEPEYATNYVYGNENASEFDNFGGPLVGIIVFFLVFLIAGINFLTERTSGTLEKVLSTPIRRSEIIIGYVLGFSILAIAQTAVVTFFVVYILNISVAGSIGYVFLICLLTAMSALTLGILLSTLANSEFQMVQFIPIVILPQIFLCGLFKMSSAWDALGHIFPLYYTTSALKEVIIKGNGTSAISSDCLILVLFSVVFMFFNIQLLRKQRSI
ncbi:MAG: ABC transporter permease [Clostridiaceae bacterium]|nr:ABC transporter permease [Clostridiaceae bacterium]